MATTPTRPVTIGLIGNPNAGKTSVFNALTGARQRIGNYPGVTVEKATGSFSWNGEQCEVIDYPGLYSLAPISADEEVATTAFASGQAPDLIVYVLDGANLERNLFLFSQVVEQGIPTVVALTQTDTIQSQFTLEIAKLEAALGVPVVPVVAHKGIGVKELKEAISQALVDHPLANLNLGYPKVVVDASERLVQDFAQAGVVLSDGQARTLLLDPLNRLSFDLSGSPELRLAVEKERDALLGSASQGKTIDAQARYAWAAHVKRQVLTSVPSPKKRVTDRIDAVLTHRFWGLIFFVVLMYGVFQSIYTAASPLMELIEAGVAAVSGFVSPFLASSPAIQSLVVDGVIGGVGGVLVFLPQIVILFLFIAVLEGSGYLARAAFLMDRLLGWCGLNGRAFIPLLSSFACAIPGILAARVMPDQKSRLVTVLVAPLMSCSARLPVYVLLIGVVIEPKFGPWWAGFALFAMHFIGMLVAIPVVWFLNKKVVKGKRLPFMLELPQYQWPKARDVGLTIVSRIKVFLGTAGTIIVAMSVIIWALLYFPRPNEAALKAEYEALTPQVRSTVSLEHFQERRQREDSLLGRFGKTLEPAFVPAGFDWRLTTAILAAFPAREVVVPAMGILFQQGGDVDESSKGLAEAMREATWPDGRPLITPWSATSLMVFFALCCQCMATLATIKRETGGWKWPIFAFTYMTALAYLFAVAITQIGRFFGS